MKVMGAISLLPVRGEISDCKMLDEGTGELSDGGAEDVGRVVLSRRSSTETGAFASVSSRLSFIVHEAVKNSAIMMGKINTFFNFNTLLYDILSVILYPAEGNVSIKIKNLKNYATKMLF